VKTLGRISLKGTRGCKLCQLRKEFIPEGSPLCLSCSSMAAKQTPAVQAFLTAWVQIPSK
jgi:hypothetical protein